MNPDPNRNFFFDSGMESSYSSSSHESLESGDGSSDDQERDDDRIDEASQECASSENLMPNESQLSIESAAKVFTTQQLEPEVGMVFHSEDQAYAFYNTYAMRKGFSVRKGHISRRKDGTLRLRVYLCSFEGTRHKHATHITKKPRPIERTNCMARIEYKVTKEQVWVVNKVIHEHNHPLLRPNKAHLLRSHRRLFIHAQAGTLSPSQITDLEVRPSSQELPVAAGQEAEMVEFLLREQSSYLHTDRMRELEKGDVQLLLDFLKSRQLEDPSFFYAVQIDDREQVTNIFWSDPRSMMDYAYFGDVVSFDTTYRASKNDIPIALFIGTNHHKQAVLFGSALLLDETTESFVWLLKTFMVAMSNQQPRTIFTDHCASIERAVNMTLPESCHRVCLWHISQNSAKSMSHLHSSESNFQKEFKSCMYECSSEEEFNSGWMNLISKYNLSTNSYVGELYNNRVKWALFHAKDAFTAGMTTVEWSDTMKKLFKRNFNRRLPLSKFLEQYQKSLVQFRKKELIEDYRSRQSKPVLLIEMPMLNEAAESYTRLIYKDFEDEFKGQLSCLCEPVAMVEATLTFKVSLPAKQYFGLVEFNPSTYKVACSCRKFESVGILCMHALKVLNNNNILHLPSHYLLKRWTKYANDGMGSNRHQSVVQAFGEQHLMSRFSRVCHKAITITSKSAFSKDALDIFENELNKVMIEVENLLRTAQPSKELEIKDGVDGSQDVPETSKKKRGRPKGSFKRRPQPVHESSDMAMTTQPIERQANDPSSARRMVEEPSHVPNYERDGTLAYNNSIPMHHSALQAYPQEHVMPTQEQFTSSPNLFDQAMASQGVGSPNLAWCPPPRGPVQGQTSNFLNWAMHPQNIPSMGGLSQRHLDQSVHSAVTGQHQSFSRSLNFDINKGS